MDNTLRLLLVALYCFSERAATRAASHASRLCSFRADCQQAAGGRRALLPHGETNSWHRANFKNQTYDITEVPKAPFTEYPAFIVETPVSFCSEYARYTRRMRRVTRRGHRDLVLQDRFDKAEDVAFAAILCLRMLHPHQVRDAPDAARGACLCRRARTA